MRALIWHVHGSYLTAMVQGGVRWLLPVVPDRGPEGRGRAQTWDWPATAEEVTADEAAAAEVDVVVLQRPEELAWCERWLGGRVPGRDVPALYLEHNVPKELVHARHPAADWPHRLPVVHVTHTNRLLWDCGDQPTLVVEHGVPDPGHRATAELAAAGAAINEPVRRGRVVGADLIPLLRQQVQVDLFGMRSEPMGGRDVPQAVLHEELARRRCYLHPFRWTSLGLALLEAMHLGLPVVAVAGPEVAATVPAEAGVVTNDLDALAAALRRFTADPDESLAAGKAARDAALARHGLPRFLSDWDRVLEEVAG